MKPAAFGLAAGLAFGLSGACLADDLSASEQFAGTTVGFELKGGPFSHVTLSISGPNDFHASAFSRRGAPSLNLRSFGAVEDGRYTYQLTAATDEKLKIRTTLDDGRDPRTAAEPLKGVSTSGTFNVRGGEIVKRDISKEPTRRDQDQR
jgi:hypothetical protein